MDVLGITLDLSITLGNLMQLGGTICAVVIAYYGLRERLVRIETQTAPVVEWWNKRQASQRRAEDRQ